MNDPKQTAAAPPSAGGEPLGPSTARRAWQGPGEQLPAGGAADLKPDGERLLKSPPNVHPERSSAEAEVARQILEIVRAKPNAVLGVATGGTMVGVYRELRSRAAEIDFTGIRAFSLDEFLGLGRPDGHLHPRSFRAFLEEHLVRPLGLRPEQLSTPDSTLAARDPKAAAASYEDEMAEAGGVDIQLLGIGRNGHVAFNEPGSLAASRTRVIELDSVTRRDAIGAFGSEGAVPTRAITVGIATIMEAKRLRLLAFGEEKAAAIERTVRGPAGSDVPATWLSAHGDLELHLDRGAAGLL